MAPARRVGTTTSKTRALLLDVAEQLMLDEGYAAVTSRRISTIAGVKPPLVYYYFPTLDELFIALFRRHTERYVKSLSEALQAKPPLRAIWDFANDADEAAFLAEYLALANHRKAIQTEIATVSERLRQMQLEALSGVLEGYGIDGNLFPPDALVVLMAAIPRLIRGEEALGIRTGHDALQALVEHYLDKFEGSVEPSNRRS